MVALTWKGWEEVFCLFANTYFKCNILAKLLKYFNKDLFGLGTGGVSINLRPLERAWFERFLMYLSFCALVLCVKSLSRLFRLRECF